MTETDKLFPARPLLSEDELILIVEGSVGLGAVFSRTFSHVVKVRHARREGDDAECNHVPVLNKIVKNYDNFIYDVT